MTRWILCLCLAPLLAPVAYAQGSGTVAAHTWTNADAFSDVDLNEEVRIAGAWNQSLTLLWLEDGDVPDDRDLRRNSESESEDPLLQELDGNLPWPGRHRRR